MGNNQSDGHGTPGQAFRSIPPGSNLPPSSTAYSVPSHDPSNNAMGGGVEVNDLSLNLSPPHSSRSHDHNNNPGGNFNIGTLPASAMMGMSTAANSAVSPSAGGYNSAMVNPTNPTATPMSPALHAVDMSAQQMVPGGYYHTNGGQQYYMGPDGQMMAAPAMMDGGMGGGAMITDSNQMMRPLGGEGEDELAAAAAAAMHGGAGGGLDEAYFTSQKNVETVPTLFKWSHGGSEVYLTGSFNNWQGKIMMYKNDDNEFVLIIDIPPGIHHYKYIVDSEWRLDDEAPTVVHNGIENNIIEVKRPVFEYTPATYDSDEEDGGASSGSDSDGGGGNLATPSGQPSTKKQKAAYGQRAPLSSDYVQDPPKLPPQLHDVHLNTIQSADPLMLPVPQHVSLNHLYLLNGTDPMVLVTSITQRFRPNKNALASHKFVTTIYVSPRPAAPDQPGASMVTSNSPSLVPSSFPNAYASPPPNLLPPPVSTFSVSPSPPITSSIANVPASIWSADLSQIPGGGYSGHSESPGDHGSVHQTQLLHPPIIISAPTSQEYHSNNNTNNSSDINHPMNLSVNGTPMNLLSANHMTPGTVPLTGLTHILSPNNIRSSSDSPAPQYPEHT